MSCAHRLIPSPSGIMVRAHRLIILQVHPPQRRARGDEGRGPTGAVASLAGARLLEGATVWDGWQVL